MISPEFKEVMEKVQDSSWTKVSIADAISWMLEKLPAFSYGASEFLKYLDEDDSLCVKDSNGNILVLTEYYESNIHCIVNAGIFEYWNPTELDFWLSLFSEESLNELGLTHSKNPVFSVAGFDKNKFNSFDEYLSSVSNNFKPHLFGEKSKHLEYDIIDGISYRNIPPSLWSSILARDVSIEHSYNQIFRAMELNPNMKSYTLLVKVDGIVSAAGLFLEDEESQYFCTVLINQADSLKKYSLYAMCHLHLISRAIDKKLSHWTGFFFPFKTIAGYLPTPINCIEHKSDTYQEKQFDWCCSYPEHLTRLQELSNEYPEHEVQLIIVKDKQLNPQSMYISIWDGNKQLKENL